MDKTNTLVLSFLDLRRCVGVLGFILPFVLLAGNSVIEGELHLEPSISDYYHTGMRDIFVGISIAIGVFLLSYRGYDQRDRIASRFAGVCITGVALLPVAPAESATATQTVVGTFHLIFASLYFLTLAYFCLVLFRQSHPNKPISDRKRLRNRVYTLSGWTILIAFALLVGTQFLAGRFKNCTVKPCLLVRNVCANGVWRILVCERKRIVGGLINRLMLRLKKPQARPFE